MAQPALLTVTYDPTDSIVGNGVLGQVSATVQADGVSWRLLSQDLPGEVLVGTFPNSENPNSILPQVINQLWPLRGGQQLAAVRSERRTPRGPIGLSVVGIVMFGPEADQLVPGNRGTFWNINAITANIFGEDQYGGHPTQTGAYHYHDTEFITGNAWEYIPGFLDGYRQFDGHSKIIGWAADGYPIYGPYGYQDPNSANSLVIKMRSGYVQGIQPNRPADPVLRVKGNYTKTNTITLMNPDVAWPGLTLTGPTFRGGQAKVLQKNGNQIVIDQRINVTHNQELYGVWPIGIFTEDYVYSSSAGGTLDQHNGRYCVTPEYPNGTYAYFATEDSQGNPAYPYFIGNTFYGTLQITPPPPPPPLTWVTAAGDLGTIAQGVFYQIPIQATAGTNTVYYQLLSGNLPSGLQVIRTGQIAGVPTTSATTGFREDLFSKFAIRAYTETTVNGQLVVDKIADRTFTMTVSGRVLPKWITPAGLIGAYYDGAPITPIQLTYIDPVGVILIRLAGGQLPPGLSVSATGEIYGVLLPAAIIEEPPGYDLTPDDVYGYDYLIKSVSKNYQFTLEITDGVNSDLRTFEIFVQSRDALTADNDYITADDTIITADQSNNRVPFLTNPQGSIGTVTHDNWFAYQFTGVDLDAQRVQYNITIRDEPGDNWSLPPGLSLDPNTGWLYGYLPALGQSEITYTLAIRVSQYYDPTVISDYYFYTLTIIAGVDKRIVWLTPSDLGTINLSLIHI